MISIKRLNAMRKDALTTCSVNPVALNTLKKAVLELTQELIDQHLIMKGFHSGKPNSAQSMGCDRQQ